MTYRITNIISVTDLGDAVAAKLGWNSASRDFSFGLLSPARREQENLRGNVPPEFDAI